jgi:DNA-binding transcriptional LysR family regulator
MIDNQLRYFMVAAIHEHLGHAADELGLSQPALSRSISRLEDKYGVQLFDRSGRRMRLNAAGRLLLAHAERALAELEDASRELQETKAKSGPIVSIGFLATFGTRVIPDLIRKFKATKPGVQFRLLQGPYPVLLERLVGGQIDLCLVSPRFVDPNLDWRPLFNEEIIALVPRGHKLAARVQIDLLELAKEPIVALKKGYGMRQYLDDLCRQSGFAPEIAFEGEEVATLHGLVGAGFGIALVPKGEFRNTDLIRTLPVREPVCRRTIGLTWRRGRYMPGKTEEFRDHIITAFPQP